MNADKNSPADKIVGSTDLLERVEFDALQPDETYEVLLLCADCKAEMNRTRGMTGAEIKQHWLKLVMGSGFNAGKCKHGCRSTFSDLNINTDLVIVRSN